MQADISVWARTLRIIFVWKTDSSLLWSAPNIICNIWVPDESEPEQDKFVIDGNEVSEEEYNSAVGEYEALEWTAVGQGNRFFDLEDGERIIDEYGK